VMDLIWWMSQRVLANYNGSTLSMFRSKSWMCGLIVNSGKQVIGNKVLGIFDNVDLDQSTGFCK